MEKKEALIQKRNDMKALLRDKALDIITKIDDGEPVVGEKLKEKLETDNEILIRMEVSAHGNTESRNFRVWNTVNGIPYGEDYWVVYVSDRK